MNIKSFKLEIQHFAINAKLSQAGQVCTHFGGTVQLFSQMSPCRCGPKSCFGSKCLAFLRLKSKYVPLLCQKSMDSLLKNALNLLFKANSTEN